MGTILVPGYTHFLFPSLSALHYCVGCTIIGVGVKIKMSSTGDRDSESYGALRDKAAAVIGQYMLKGYRMLASHCPDCGVRHKGYSKCIHNLGVARPLMVWEH